MRLLLTILLFVTINTHATTYYFSTSGSDLNSGTSSAAPWKTLGKFNAFINSAVAGDVFLLKRGEVFYGSIKITKAGVTIGAYGTGNNPIITGFTSLTSWTNVGANLWESSVNTSLNMVVVNGVNVAMGRFPNSGYLTYTAPTLTTKTVSGLATNWTGATAVMRLHHWITDNNLITAQSGNIITHTNTPNSTFYKGIEGYGLFIQNDARTLDIPNEWYYNPSTKKLRLYSATAPTNVQVPTIDTLVWLPQGKNNITIKDIAFTGSNKIAIAINSCANVTIQNCQFDFHGQDVIWGGQNWGMPSSNFRFLNNTVNHTNNNAILLMNEFTGALIQGNTFKNTGMQAGMGKGGDGQMNTIRIQAHGFIIEKNTIDSTGYMPIHFVGNNGRVQYNFITNYNMVKMDGGGIYSYIGSGTANTGTRVHHNIVLNSYPSTLGTSQSVGLGHGIYLDNNTDNIQVDSNSVAYMAYSCMYMNTGATNNNIFGNTFYNGAVTEILQKESANTLSNNIVVRKGANQRFEYNPSFINKTVALDGLYKDVKGVSYNNSITLAPWSSAVLTKDLTALPLDTTTRRRKKPREQNTLSVYPNPFIQEVTVQVNEPSLVQLYNALGQSLYHSKVNSITKIYVTQPKGIYFLQVTGKQKQTFTLIKQ